VARYEQPGETYWLVVKPVWKKISIYDGGDEYLRQFRAVPPVAGHLFAAHWCQSEVCNGGLHQFFYNPTGVLAPEAVAGFRSIGLTDLADILAEAMRFFGEPYPREQADRHEAFAKCEGKLREEWDPFFDLDKRFYSWLLGEPNRWERAADRFAEAQMG
jgi:hypothetical protein